MGLVSPIDKFKVEVSGGNIVQSASNVANTMFADRLTKSILSDETIEQQVLQAQRANEIEAIQPVTTEDFSPENVIVKETETVEIQDMRLDVRGSQEEVETI